MSRATTSRLKVNPPLGLRPSLEFRRIHELKIDPAYQRTIDTGGSQTLMRRIAMFWDWGLCQPLTVAKREDGTLMVVDGQHRLAAAKLRNDIYDLPCVVTAYANASDEAAAFVALNQQRRPLSKLDLFKAALAAEDNDAVAISRLLAAAGLTLASTTNPTGWKPGMISNIAGVQNCFRWNGPKVTAAALDAIARGFAGQVLRYVGSIFPGVASFLGEAAKAKRNVDQELLVVVLSGLDQAEWLREIALAGAAGATNRQIAGRAAIQKAYDEAFDDDDREAA